MKLTLKFSLFFLIGLSFQALGANPALEWRVHTSEHFKIHYPTQLKSFVPKVQSLAEASHEELSPFFKWEPKNKTNVVLIDEFDQANGFASPLPQNTITLFMQPPTGGELLAFDDWLKLLIHHEYTHTLHIDKVLNLPSFFRSIFGRFILFFPNALHPNWFQEGLATYLETDDDQGVGRGQSDFFQMMMRTEIETGFKPVSRINVVNSHDWPLNTAYLYGVYFFKFIRDVYGEQAILQLVDNYSENLVPYRVSSNPIQVTGKDLTEIWTEFEQYVKGYFQPQVERITKSELTLNEWLNTDYFSYGEFDQANGDIWFSATDQYKGSHLYRQSLESVNQAEAMVALNSLGSLDVNDQGDVLLSQIDICDNYNAYYDLYVFKQGSLVRLTECQRYREGRWLSSDRILALRYDAAIPYLDEINSSGEFVRNVWTGKAGYIISSFSVDDQGNVVAAIKLNRESWQIALLKDQKWTYLTKSPVLKMYPVIQGDQVAFVQAQLGQLEVHAVPMSGGDVSRLTQTETGWGRIQLTTKTDGIGLMYTHSGYKLAKFSGDELPALYISKNEQKRQEAQAWSSETVEIDEESYIPIKSLMPSYWMPVFAGEGELSEVGVFTSGSDVLSNHIYTAQVTYESTTSTSLVNGSYLYANRIISAVGQSLSETDQAGVFEQNNQWLLGYMHPYISIQNSFYPYVAVAQENVSWRTEQETLNIGEIDNNWIGIGVVYDGLRSSHWAADHTDGWLVTASLESANLADNSIREGDVLSLSARHYHTFDNNHILAQRFLSGNGFDSNSNFTLGGSQSDAYIGPGVTLNERSYPLRGYEQVDGLIGENVLLHSIEYRLPFKWRDHTIMAPPVGVSGWSLRGFADNGLAWQDGEDIGQAEHKAGVGAEIVFDSNLFYYLNIKFRLGLASGLSEGGDTILYTEFGGSF